MRRFFTFFIVLFGLMPASILAKVSIVAEIDSTIITLEDEAQILVTVEGASTDEPVVPQVAGLDIVQTGRRSEFSFVNGAMSYRNSYNYTVVPSDVGQYEISGFIVYSDGHEYKSNSLKLTVSGGRAPASGQTVLPPSSLGTSNDGKIDQQAQQKIQDAINEDAPFWLTTQVSETEPYLNQQFLYHFKFFSRVSVNIDDVQLPKFDDFYAEVVIPERKGRETIGNQSYTTYEIVYALYPLKTGALQIAKSGLSLSYRDPKKRSKNFDPFFGSSQLVRKNLSATEIDITVKELPAPVPKDFTNLVGHFSIEAAWDRQSLKEGESATLKVSLSGSGNIKDATLPDWQTNDFKIYKDKPLFESAVNEDGLFGKKTFEVAVLPTRSGKLVFPSLTLSYFDLSKDHYESLLIPETTIEVLPDPTLASQNTSSVFVGPQSGLPKSQLEPSLDFYGDSKAAATFFIFNLQQKTFWILFLSPLLILCAYFLWHGFFSNRKQGASQRKSVKKELSQLKKIAKNPEVSAFDVYACARTLMSYILKNQAVRSMTPSEMIRLLREDKITENLLGRIEPLFEKFEMQNYGFAKNNITNTDRETLASLMEDLCRAKNL